MNTSAEARVIASFTFIVAMLLGAWVGIEDLLAGRQRDLISLDLVRIVVAMLPFAATAVAFQATNAAEAAWARALGGAAVMLGVLTCIGGVFYLVGNA